MARRISPGPSWAVLPEPTSSSPSTRTSVRSDTSIDIDLDAYMTDDETEHDLGPTDARTPIVKRKAPPAHRSASPRKPQKLPRLEGLASVGHTAAASSTSSSSSRDEGHASRTQPAPLMSTQKNAEKPVTPERSRASRASSGTPPSEFPQTFSQIVRDANARDRQKEKEKEMEKRQDEATSSQRGPPMTARKRTVKAKNIHKVTMGSLLKNAQKSSDLRDESAAWTRIRPRGKQKRTSYNAEMAYVRPLDSAERRGGRDVIELTDSSDSMHHTRPSHPSASSGPRSGALVNEDDPIIIMSSSEDELALTARLSSRRKSGPSGTQGKRGPPPADAEVISILDSDEDTGTNGVAPGRQTAPTAPASTPPSQQALAVPQPAPESATVPAPTMTPVSTTPPLTSERPPLARQDNETSPQPSPPPYVPPPDDFDNAFGDMDFDATGNDGHPNGTVDGWDNIDVGPSMATLPGATSSGLAVAVGASTTTNVPGATEDASGPDALFDSYVNMDQLGGGVDQEMRKDAPRGDDNETERVIEDGVTNGLGALLPKHLPTSGADVSPNVDGDEGGDTRMRSLEEGEVESNEASVPPARALGTPESGEIRSQGSSSEAWKQSQPSSQLAPTSTLAQPPPALENLHSSMSANTASQPLERARTLVIPDISLYKGVRFKRPLPDARENPFFSRALNGAVRSGKAPVSLGTTNEGNAPGDVSAPADAQSGVGKVQNQGGDADMQDDTDVSMLEPSTAPIVSTPSSVSQQPAEAPTIPDSSSALSTPQVQPPTVEPSASTDDIPLPSTQPAISSTPVALSQPPAATQPLVRSSSRPYVAPPRIPRPSTPMSLVEVLNEVRRERLQARKEERELARKRNADRFSAEHAAPHKCASQDPKEVSTPPPSQSSTVELSASQRARQLEKTPSLDGLRTLLTRRNAGARRSARPTPTSASRSASVDDRDSRASAEHVAVPAPATTQVPQVAPPADGKDGPSSEGARVTKGVAWGTSTPTTSSSESRSPGARTRRRRTLALVPFEAFISPGTKNKKGGDATDPFVPPTADGTSWRGSQKRKGRASWHGRRESASTAFEAYIVRDSAKRTSPVRSGTRIGTDDAQPPRQPEFSEGPGSSSVESPVVHDAVPASVSGLVNGEDGGGRAGNANTTDMTVEGRLGVDSTCLDDGVALGESGRKGESELMTREVAADETDALLGLASVHLSQPEEVPEPFVDEGGEMVVDESAGSLVVGESGQEAGNAMMVDGSPEDPEMGHSKGKAVPQTVLHDATSQIEGTEPAPPAVVTSALENNVADTSAVALEEGVAQNGLALPLSYSTTPDLVLPEDDSTSDIELPSTAGNADRDVAGDCAHERVCSGGADSVEECDALLTAPGEREPELRVVPVGSLVSSRTVSSTSMALPRVRSQSSQSKSRRRLPSRAASSGPSDLARHPAPVPGRADSTSAPRTDSKDVDGYRVITWKSYVAEQRERAPEYKLAKNIPHSLQDHMNALPAAFRDSDVARRIFEAHIQEAMTNEPDTPLIGIFDNDIGDEVTPRWEFHYTNDIWYGEGVPPPDVKHLKSCGCIGRCDPKSKTCACAQRQLRWVQPYIDADIIPSTWPGSPFVYDQKGTLQRTECPIFECNQFCDCDDDCPNRVVQNGRKWPVHIVRTMHKGWGVSAGNKKIPKGSYVGVYAGELLTEQEGDARGRYYDLYGRTYLFSVDFHHLKLGMENPDEWENLYVVDAYHAGNFTRFLNHSCDPNCKILACYIDDADVDKPLLVVFTTRDVEPWEELCFSYYGDIDEKREEIEEERKAGIDSVREHAVYAQCRCEADNCIGRLFS